MNARPSTIEHPRADAVAPEGTAPHTPLPQYYREEMQRAPWVRGVFDRTAVDYDRIERLMAFGTGPWYRRHALLRGGLAPGMQVLDVGTGTGLTARAAIEIVGDASRVIGVDPSPGMLAASTVSAESPRIVGCGEALPIASNAIDFLCMGFALRHVADLDAVFAEYFRVLRAGGRLCILEITRPQHRSHFLALRFYLRGVVPLLARAFGRSDETPELMRYYWDTIEACVPPPVVMDRLRHAGFDRVDRHVEADMFSEYCAVKAG